MGDGNCRLRTKVCWCVFGNVGCSVSRILFVVRDFCELYLYIAFNML